MGRFLAHCLRSRSVSFLCAVVLALALLLPPGRGFGVPTCPFRMRTGYPCLSCGLTRSFIGMAHLDFDQAVFYHPAGLLLFPPTAFLALLLPAPTALRERLARAAQRHGRLFDRLAVAFLVLFVVYGLGRIAWLAVSHRPSPW